MNLLFDSYRYPSETIKFASRMLVGFTEGLRFHLFDGKVHAVTNSRCTQIWWFGPTGDEW